MTLLRKVQLLKNSIERMKAGIEGMEEGAREYETIRKTAAAGNLPVPQVERWWGFMRRESWIQVKRSLGLWWHIIMLKK